MPSHTKILIVEDDKFKLDSVRAFLLDEINADVDIHHCGAISTATQFLAANRYDVVIIDMSIPSHPTAVGEGSPYSFPSGGLDVLFEVEERGHNSTCIILTQYPDIEMEEVLIPVDEAQEQIRIRFQIEVAACVRYLEDSYEWKQQIAKCLEAR